MTDVFILLGMGAVAGILAGLLGVGGGIIIVPVLVLVFEHQNVSPEVLMHVAIGTSLATIVVTSISSIHSHQKHKAVLWPVFRQITPGVLLGAFLGALVARVLSGDDLRIAFGVFMLIVALRMMFGGTAKPQRHLPGQAGMIIVGILIGGVASLMGVGGGLMSVPFMTWCNVSMHNAVATSAAIGLPLAAAGATGFIIVGWTIAGRPPLSIGYVNIPAFFSIVVASILFAPLGVKLTHRISARRLQLIFGLFLIMLSVKIFY